MLQFCSIQTSGNHIFLKGLFTAKSWEKYFFGKEFGLRPTFDQVFIPDKLLLSWKKGQLKYLFKTV